MWYDWELILFVIVVMAFGLLPFVPEVVLWLFTNRLKADERFVGRKWWPWLLMLLGFIGGVTAILIVDIPWSAFVVAFIIFVSCSCYFLRKEIQRKRVSQKAESKNST